MGVIDPGETYTVLPEQFGKYSLLGHLATGGMAEVWLARQQGLQGFEKIVVIKRARPELTDPGTVRRFLDEARLVATLEHPNIAQVYEIGFVSGSYFFVMEYVDGADLRQVIEAAIAKRQRIALADALYILIHVCTALHYAHEKHDLGGDALNIIHRDVSPSNVLISHDGAVKVCDFGVAKASQRGPQGGMENTQDGVLKGKFSYMSPEQCQSLPLDRRSDVFSIGVLLYELTTLSKLFRARSDYALLQQVAEARIPPPSLRVPGYPRELEQIVMRALARDPADRYPTAQALQLALEEFAREHKLAMSSTRITQLMRSLIERRNDARIRARGSRFDGILRGDSTASSISNAAAFLADGSEPSAGGERMTPLSSGMIVPANVLTMPGGTASASVSTSASAISEPPARRGTALWLVGAAIAGIFGVGVTVADQMAISAEDRATAAALSADAEKIASTLDAAARAGHMRADGIATTPMLRAAIETDAATLGDLATNEMVFTAGKDEALEVFQFTHGKATPLLRIPKTAPALQPLQGREARVHSDGRGLTVAASAPISGTAGGIVVAMPVDLGAVQRSLAQHAISASIVGLGSELVVVPAGTGLAGAPVDLPVPAIGAWTASGVTLKAAPRRTAGLAWAKPVRAASGGLCALLLLGFVVSLVRRPRA